AALERGDGRPGAGAERDERVGADLVRDRLAAHATADLELPQHFAVRRVECDRVAVAGAGDDDAASRRERAARHWVLVAIAPTDLPGRDVDRVQVAIGFLRGDVGRLRQTSHVRISLRTNRNALDELLARLDRRDVDRLEAGVHRTGPRAVHTAHVAG